MHIFHNDNDSFNIITTAVEAFIKDLFLYSGMFAPEFIRNLEEIFHVYQCEHCVHWKPICRLDIMTYKYQIVPCIVEQTIEA